MKFNLTRLSLFLAICLVFVSTAMASTTCPSTNYGDYNPAPPGSGPSITCTTDNLQFSQFGFTSTSGGGAIKPTPSSIGVTVEDPAVTPGLDGPGFDFNPGFAVGPGGSQDGKISFQVTALNGTSINDLFIFFNGSVSNPPGGASAVYSETYCTISFTQGCNIFQVQNPPPNLSQTIWLTPGVTSLYITKDFSVSGGTNGSAGISTVVNEFSSPVPEPREIGLLIFAMVGLVLAHRKIKAAVN